jgi:RNA polymerase sigma-70 factor (ECF subfamily)
MATHCAVGRRTRSGTGRVNNAGRNHGDAIAREARGDVVALTFSGSAHEQVYRVASAAIRRVLGPGHAEIDDVVQTAVERVLRGLQGGQFSGLCSLPTWVTTVARHAALDEKRSRELKQSSLCSELCSDSVAPHMDPEGQLEARLTLARVAAVLGSMDQLTAEIMVMHDIVGHSLAEIADLKQLSVAAAQSRLVRGRKVLFARFDATRASS